MAKVFEPRRLLPLSLFLLLPGCPEVEEGFVFDLLTVKSRAACGNSPAKGSGGAPLTGLQKGVYTLRFTFLQRKDASVNSVSLRHGYEVACWHVFGKGAKQELLIPEKVEAAGGRYTVVVEAFKDDKLWYVGRNESMKIAPDGQGVVYMRPTVAADFADPKSQGFSCVDQQKLYRAFHSATLLPNGQVLLYGGVIGELDGDTFDTNKNLAFATGSVEVYRPTELGFWAVKGDLPRRAFHHAVLLPSPPAGPYRILVIGGIQPKEPTPQSPLLELKTSETPFILNPHPDATAAPALVITYDPESDSASSQEVAALPTAMFPAAAVKSDGATLVLAGGAAAATWTTTTPAKQTGFTGPKSLHLIDLPASGDPSVRATTTMNNVRVGHTLALMGEDSHVVVGGQMDGQLADDGEYLAGSGSPTAFAFPKGTASSMPVAWHTLTPIGATDQELFDGTNAPGGALWAGGFTLSQWAGASDPLRGTANPPNPRPQQDALHLVREGSPPTADEVTTESGGTLTPGHYATTGYHAATRLPDGSVLLTGGKVDCGGDSAYCASNQAVIYALYGGVIQLRAGTWELTEPRFGHRVTRLLDNSLLVTGGITLERQDGTKRPKVLKKAELFQPRTGDASEDLPLERSAPTDQDQVPPDQVCQARD
jgi:hypothetical protein